MRSKAVAIIPARWGSTRFPGKPLHVIAGEPLLKRVWERCQRASDLDAIIIATDDIRIAEAAFAWGAEVSLTSTKHQSGTDRAAEIASRARKFTHIINVQGDEPLVDPKLIDRLVQTLRNDRKVEMVTAAHPFADAADVPSPHQVKVVVNAAGDALYFSRSAIPFVRDGDVNVEHLRHQGIYGYTRSLLLCFVAWKRSALERAESLEQLRALENGVRIRVLVTKTGSPGIDTLDDAVTLEKLLTTAKRKVVRG
jgi:3-deoxy-manno-octulosonate cytidylyltransferase (CMP-KDO synthetase)